MLIISMYRYLALEQGLQGPHVHENSRFVQIAFALVAATQSDKSPNGWGRKVIATNPEGLKAGVSVMTAGNTMLELAFAMCVVRMDRDLSKLKWGDKVPLKEECGEWCASPVLCAARFCCKCLCCEFRHHRPGCTRSAMWSWCRFVMAKDDGVLFNPYVSEDRGGIGRMVASLGDKAGVSVRPRQCRQAMVTNVVAEDGLAGRRTDMGAMCNQGGWAQGSEVPLNVYNSNSAMSASQSHLVRCTQ